MFVPRVQSQPGFRFAALVCAVTGAVLFLFFGNATRGYVNTPSLFWWWISQWLDPKAESQHGWLILAISVWLFWRNVRGADGKTDQRDPTPTAAGLRMPPAVALAMIAGLGFHALGFVAQQTRISIIGMLVFAWGVLRLAGGRRWGRAAMFPLGFLVFAIPINMLDTAGFWLRMWVIDATTAIAHVLNIGVLRSGTQLLAPDGRYQYDVVAECSGVRSLVALTALSLLVGYLSFQSPWRRTIVLLLCLPLVYLGNVVRLVTIIVAAQLGGPGWGGIAHEVMGFGVFGLVLGGVLLAAGALQRWWPEGRQSGPGEPSSAVEEGKARSGADGGAPVSTGAWIGVLAIVAVAVGEMIFLHRLVHAPPRGKAGVALSADGSNPVDLPAFLGTEWIGRRAEVTAIELQSLPPDTGFSRRSYISMADGTKRVFLSVVLSGRDRTSIHRPEICLVGQGWTITGESRHEFRFPGRPEAAFPVTLLRVRREVPTPRGPVVVPELVAYWFVSGDAIVATHWQRFAHDAWNRVARARADRWAYVLMQSDTRDGEGAAIARMQAVLDATLPAFQRPMAK